MQFDVCAFPDPRGRWHWHLLSIPQDASAVGVYRTCNHSGCPGFADADSAEAEGWRQVREISRAGS